MSDLTKDFSAQIGDAAATRQPLEIIGGGSKRWYGNATTQTLRPLNTTGHHGIVDYDPAELVVTARSGTPLAELEKTLSEHGQMLAFEPPNHAPHAPGATLGGAIACALSGPARPYLGGVRDFVLGLHVIDGKGELLKFGGQVMKNVAGYDVSRLMTGALGTLGLLTQVSLKVLPMPPASATLAFELDEASAITRVNEWAGQPLPLTASVWQDGVLYLRLAGARAAVDFAVQHLGGSPLAASAADALWASLRDQTHAFFAGGESNDENKDSTLWRLSLPSTAPAIGAAAGNTGQLIEWGGAQRWLWSAAPAHDLRALARQRGGHAVRFDNRHGAADVETFDALSPALMAIHQRLKQHFDPQGIFNPGRLYSGL